MIKISLLLISIFSLLYGLVFSFAPYFFAELTQAEPTNIAWLRNIGASICGVLFFGLLYVYRSPSKNYDLFMIITITSILQTLGLIFSRFYNEFSAQNTQPNRSKSRFSLIRKILEPPKLFPMNFLEHLVCSTSCI